MVNNNILAVLVIVAILASLGTSLVAFGLIGTMKIGFATGITSINVQSQTDISLPTSNVAFGTLGLGAKDDTLDNSPLPFVVRNDGSVFVDVTIDGTNLFANAPNPSANYQFECGDLEIACPLGSVATWTNMPPAGSPVLAIKSLPFADSGDEVQVEIAVTVPADEPAGVKSSTVTFTASQTI